MWTGVRLSSSLVSRRNVSARRRAGEDDRDREQQQREGGRGDTATRRGTAGRARIAQHRAPREWHQPVFGRALGRNEAIEDRPRGAQHDESGQQRHLRPELVALGGHAQDAGDRDERAEDHAPDSPAGTVLGSVIMKNRKIIVSGEVTMTRQ